MGIRSRISEERAAQVARLVAVHSVPEAAALEFWEVSDLGFAVDVAWRDAAGMRGAKRVRLNAGQHGCGYFNLAGYAGPCAGCGSPLA